MGGTDTLRSIEDVSGSAGNDTIIGNAGANWLLGNAGDDTLDGGAGNDTLEGGAGRDMASYASFTNGVGVWVNLSTGTAREGMGGTDTLSSIEDVAGSAGNDIIIGNADANLLVGNAGNDILIGGAGNDILIGGAGNDTFIINSLSEGTDTIRDFSVGDRLDLAKVTSTAPTFTSSSNNGVNGTAIWVGQTQVAWLGQVNPSQLRYSGGFIERIQ